METVEHAVVAGVQWLKLLIELVGATLIAVGTVVALGALLRALSKGRGANFTAVRLTFARYLVLALEFQLAADILATAVAPTWNDIGKLAAIAVIRTVLNYFLVREMKDEAAEIEAEHAASTDESLPPSGERRMPTGRRP